MKSFYQRLFLFVLFVLANHLNAFSQSEQIDGQNNYEEALQKLQNREYSEAIQIFDALLLEQPNKTEVLYNRGKATLLNFQAYKSVELKTEDLRFKNFQSQHDTLKLAFELTQKALENYRSLSTASKNDLVQKGISNFKDVYNLKEGIAKEAANLILKAYYYIPHERLPLTPPYNRPEYAYTTKALRHQLVIQASDFLENFEKTRVYGSIKSARKSLLAEYINIPSLRARGTGNGYLYEKYCDCILEDYSEEELRNIISEFYGANWNFPLYGYQSKEDYKKIEAFAKENSLTVIGLFCKLNIHYKGIVEQDGTCLNCDLYDDFIKAFAPHQLAYVALQRRASPHILKKKWQEAAQIYSSFKDYFPKQKNSIEKTITLLKAPEDNLFLENLGKNINTEKTETAPVPFLDNAGNEGLYFCRMNLGTGQDVYFAPLQDGKYQTAVRLSGNVNTATHEVPQSVSFDGSTLVLFGNYGALDAYKLEMRQQNSNLGNGDLFYAERKENASNKTQTWERIKAFPEPINTPNYEAGLSFSADGNAVFFASDRKGGVGDYLPKAPKDRLYFHGREEFNIDLWVSQRTPKGWSEPINLGEVINTPFAETQPFLHPDMKTLYFVSDGHYGIGSGDIFMSKRLSDTSWTAWSEPVNLGKSINTPFLDGFYMGNTGEFAFIVMKGADKNVEDSESSNSSYDIYRFKVPERFRPDPVKPITGTVFDENGNPIQTTIYVEDLRTGSIITSTKSSSKNGSFQVSVPFSSHLGFYAKEKGYFSTSAHQTKENDQEKDKSLRVFDVNKLLTSQKNIRLNNLFFDIDSYQLQKISYPELSRLATILKENPMLKIVIQGHTDNTGKEDYNLSLSQNRAKTVAEYLISLGIFSQRVRYEGFGASKPIADNFDEKGRRLNRRVEFRLER